MLLDPDTPPACGAEEVMADIALLSCASPDSLSVLPNPLTWDPVLPVAVAAVVDNETGLLHRLLDWDELLDVVRALDLELGVISELLRLTEDDVRLCVDFELSDLDIDTPDVPASRFPGVAFPPDVTHASELNNDGKTIEYLMGSMVQQKNRVND